GVLLIIPMFYLGKCVGGRFVGFWSALLFQALPVSGQILSDGLSEPLFLLLFAWGMFFAVRAVEKNSPWRFACCGMFCGLSYLTRPEGALLLAATGLVLLGTQWVQPWRRSWTRLAACAACMSMAAMAVASLYVAVTGRFTQKPSLQQILH